MSKINVSFKGKKYAIDKSLLSGAISSMEATLSGLSGDSPDNKVAILDEAILDHTVLE